jgi:triosephosphate isomerase (TIM)
MPRTIIAGNWKMYRTRPEALALVNAILAGAGPVPADRELFVFPAATLLATVADRCRYSRIAVGGQNLHPGREGAFTGEVSATMLIDAGATRVLVGHSERRAIFGEDDAFLARKVRAALDAGLEPVFCVGETLAEREAGRTEEVIARQIREGLGELSPDDAARLIVAYEPVWAIGTGRTALPEQAEAAHRFLRGQLVERWGSAGVEVPLLYGGSVKPGNSAELLAQPEINGVLVGGASLEAASFLGIAAAK